MTNRSCNSSTKAPSICVIGDVHGHLQLALCMAAQWQKSLDVKFEALFLCGDVGTFIDDAQLDGTTRRHAKSNPCELEFLHQWSVTPQPAWLNHIFKPAEEDGLGLTCPVVMVHGNHEGFTYLETFITGEYPTHPVPISQLPRVDSAGWIHYLPSGWKCATSSHLVVGGIGGIEKGQRKANYHELAYIDELAVLNLLESEAFDLLISHQGPAVVQGDHGSEQLNALLEAECCRYWFHGHALPNPNIASCGLNGNTTVIPLGDVAFPIKGDHTDEPGDLAWCWQLFDGKSAPVRERPVFWREYRKRKWQLQPDGQLVAPPLIPFT